MKSVDEIRLLLAKFYDGETSQVEESELLDFFKNSESIPEDLLADKAVFLSLAVIEDDALAEINVPESLSDELLLLIDHEERNNVSSNHSWWTMWRVAGIAASVCVVVALGVFMITGNRGSEIGVEESGLKHAYVPQTEEGAIAETSRALMILSEKMSRANVRLITTSVILEDDINEE